MRKAVKEQILQIFETLREAHRELQKCVEKKEYMKANALLADCQESALLIGNTIEQLEDGHEQIIHMLEQYCEEMYRVNGSFEETDRISGSEIRKKLDKQIEAVSREVNERIKVVLKVVFFPYKASMWTSLESIWKAAAADEQCEAKVVVIPYHTLDSGGNKEEFKYEASLFPKDVPIVHYSQYHVEQEHPDMIFIHNPYDDTNNVTRVPEQYYTYNLKPHTEQLIYSPYGMMGYYSPGQGAFMCCTNGVLFSDKVIVQSSRVKQIYMDHQVNENKLIALGSPKVDAIVESLKKPVVYPEGWEKKLAGRKVFLFNTHLSYFIKGYIYKSKYPDREDYAIAYHERGFLEVLKRKDCALVWRPHPLLKAMLESRNLYETLEVVKRLEKMLEESENGVLDENGEYDISFRLSDALVTTYSSIVPEYMISGKPIYIYEHRLNPDNCRNSPVNYNNLYYQAAPGEEPKFPGFIQMVLDGEDPLKEARMADVHRAFSNLEGTIGRNIYAQLCGKYV